MRSILVSTFLFVGLSFGTFIESIVNMPVSEPEIAYIECPDDCKVDPDDGKVKTVDIVWVKGVRVG